MAIQWASLSVRGSKRALRAGFMTGLPRAARHDERGESVQLRLSKCHSRQAPFVLAPAARALRAAVADDRVPITVGLRLVVGCDLKRERLAVLERFSAVEAKAWHAAHRELNRQDIAPVAAGIVGRRPVHGADRAVGKGPGVKARSVFRVMVVPQADRDAPLHAAGEPESTVLFARGSRHSYAPQCVHSRTSRRPRTRYAVNP